MYGRRSCYGWLGLALGLLGVEAALAAPGPLGFEPRRELWAPPAGPSVATAPPNAVVQVSGLSDPLAEPDAKVLHGVFSPDGKRVACAVDRGGIRHLELRDWSGSVRPVALTSGTGFDDFPCWAPDGEAVVYQSMRGNTTKLYILPMGSRREVPLTFGSGDDMHPRVSHSGRYVAFDSNRGGNSDIWLLDRETGKVGQVTFDPGADFYPAWSPDDRALAFTSGRTGKFEIWAQKLGREREAVRITYGPGHQAHPDWSAGGWIAYDSDQHGQTRILMTQPAAAVRAAAAAAGGVPVDALAQASGSIVTVTDGVSTEEFPRFSRAGRHLLIQATDGRFVSMRIRRSPVAVPAATLALAPGGVQMLAVNGSAAAAQGRPGGPARRLIVHAGSPAAGDPAIMDPGLRPGPRSLELAGLRPPASGSPPIAGMPVGVGIGMPVTAAPAPATAPAYVSSPPGESFRVLEFYPQQVPEGVPVDTPISVLFSRGLDRVMEPEKAIELVDGTERLPLIGTYNPVLKRIDVVPRAPLLAGTQYAVVVRGVIRSQEGAPLGDDQTFTFRTAGISRRSGKLSTAEFRTQTVVPGRGQRGVSQQAKVQVTFTQKFDLASMDSAAVKLTDESGEQVLGELYAPPGDTSFTLSLYKPLEEGKTYKITLSDKIRSASGAPVPQQEREWEFRTASRKVFAVVAVAPLILDGPRPRIRVRFTKPVDLRSVARGRLTLEGGGASFGGRVSNDEGGEVLVFEPYQSLPGGQEFTVALPPGLTDDEGHPLRAGKKLGVRTRPGKATQLLPRDPASPPILGLGKAAGVSKQAPKVLEKHGMPPAGSPPIITQYFGSRSSPAGALAPGGKPGPAWIYSGLRDLARRGFLGEDADPNKIGSHLTRYAVAQLVNRAGKRFATMDLQDRQLVRKLQKEYGTELASQGFDTRPQL